MDVVVDWVDDRCDDVIDAGELGGMRGILLTDLEEFKLLVVVLLKLEVLIFELEEEEEVEHEEEFSEDAERDKGGGGGA